MVIFMNSERIVGKAYFSYQFKNILKTYFSTNKLIWIENSVVSKNAVMNR